MKLLWKEIKSVVDSKDARAIDGLLAMPAFWNSSVDRIFRTGDYLRTTGNLDKAEWLVELIEGQQSRFTAAEWNTFLFLHGDLLLDQMRYPRAIDCYSQILAQEASDKAYNNRGMAYWCLGKYAEALLDYRQAIRLNPENFVAQRGAGEMCLKLNYFKEALKCFEAAIRLKADYPGAYLGRGWTFFHLHRFDEAHANFQRALELNPEDWIAKGGVALVKDMLAGE